MIRQDSAASDEVLLRCCHVRPRESLAVELLGTDSADTVRERCLQGVEVEGILQKIHHIKGYGTPALT